MNQFQDKQKWTPKLNSSFLILDIETTGLSGKAKILSLGACTVQDGVVDKSNIIDILLKTPYDPETWQAAYHPSNDKSNKFLTLMKEAGAWNKQVQESIDANNGSIYGETGVPQSIQDLVDDRGEKLFKVAYDVVGVPSAYSMEHGVDRKDALDVLHKFMSGAIENGLAICGHNFVRFDALFILREIQQELGIDMSLSDNHVLDTGIMVKAAQCGCFPFSGEQLWDFFWRVSQLRRRVKWALDRYCVPTFGMAEKYGIDTTQQHKSPGYDCWVTGCLIKEMAGGDT